MFFFLKYFWGIKRSKSPTSHLVLSEPHLILNHFPRLKDKVELLNEKHGGNKRGESGRQKKLLAIKNGGQTRSDGSQCQQQSNGFDVATTVKKTEIQNGNLHIFKANENLKWRRNEQK